MKRQSIPNNRRGALLIVAMMFAALTAIAIVSFLRLGSNSMQLAHRSFFANAAMNLAEGGLEQAMWSFEQARKNQPNPWDGWTTSGSNATRVFDEGALGLNATGKVRVLVENYTSTSAAIITARATVTPASGAEIDKWVQVNLRKRSRYGDGLISKDLIDFNGNNVTVDSWISDLNADGDANPLTGPSVPFSNGVRRDRGTVASIKVTAGSVNVGQGDVWGFVATGDSTTTAGTGAGVNVVVGANGSILGADSAAKGVTGSIDMSRVASDFTYNFEQEYTPSATNGMAAINNTTSILTSGSYLTPSISLASNKTLTIGDATHKVDVVLVISAANGVQAIKVSGNAGIVISPGSSLKIYTAGDIDIAGNGVANNGGCAASLEIVGTIPTGGSEPTTPQKMSISGNGVLSAAVYAPNAEVKLNGGGTSGVVCGSIVGKTITMNGGTAFHYDESLAELDNGAMGIAGWRELTTQAQRNAKLSELNF